MIYCPNCGGETEPYSARETDHGQERRRVCQKCGKRYKSLETLTYEIKPNGELKPLELEGGK